MLKAFIYLEEGFLFSFLNTWIFINDIAACWLEIEILNLSLSDSLSRQAQQHAPLACSVAQDHTLVYPGTGYATGREIVLMAAMN